ncbi:unnamed protein product, partial [marine sediment metagenome]
HTGGNSYCSRESPLDAERSLRNWGRRNPRQGLLPLVFPSSFPVLFLPYLCLFLFLDRSPPVALFHLP